VRQVDRVSVVSNISTRYSGVNELLNTTMTIILDSTCSAVLCCHARVGRNKSLSTTRANIQHHTCDEFGAHFLFNSTRRTGTVEHSQLAVLVVRSQSGVVAVWLLWYDLIFYCIVLIMYRVVSK
jgi:hypothetical protein